MVPVASNTFIPVNIPLVEVPLKLFLILSSTAGFLLIFSTSSNVTFEINLHFKKEEKVGGSIENCHWLFVNISQNFIV